MKRLAAVCTLILCLSFPALAGHTTPGYAYCDCGMAGCIEDYPGECGKGFTATKQSETPTDFSGLGIVLVALLYWLRTKA